VITLLFYLIVTGVVGICLFLSILFFKQQSEVAPMGKDDSLGAALLIIFLGAVGISLLDWWSKRKCPYCGKIFDKKVKVCPKCGANFNGKK